MCGILEIEKNMTYVLIINFLSVPELLLFSIKMEGGQGGVTNKLDYQNIGAIIENIASKRRVSF